MKAFFILAVTAALGYGIYKYLPRIPLPGSAEQAQLGHEIARKLGSGAPQEEELSTAAVVPAEPPKNAPPPDFRIKDRRVVMYAYGGEHEQAAAAQYARLKKLTLDVVTVTDMDGLKDLEILPSLKRDGVAYNAPDGVKVSVPFFRVDGRFYTKYDFFRLPPRLPLSRTRERASPYIVVYGPQECEGMQGAPVGGGGLLYNGQTGFYNDDCEGTARLVEQLENEGLPAEMRSVNDPDNLARQTLLGSLNGMVAPAYPLVDVNGNILQQPNIEKVKSYYGEKKKKARRRVEGEIVFE